jgi:hypothetical protein
MYHHTSIQLPSLRCDIFSDAIALLTNLTEARPLIQTELNVKTSSEGQLISILVDCAAIFDFAVSYYFVRRFSLPTRKLKVKTSIRLANGQRVRSSTLYDITFELARHEFQRTFYVLHVLHAHDTVLDLAWLDDQQASLKFGTTRVFTVVDGTKVYTHT